MRAKSVLRTLASMLCLISTGCIARAYDAPGAVARDRASPTRMTQVKQVTLTIVYDNNPHDARLSPKWGFACLVESPQARVLFDTGGDGTVLMHNMAELDIDPASIDAVVLSHAHADHTGGLAALLEAGARPVVYLPAAFPAKFKREVSAQTELLEVDAPVEVAPGIYAGGEVGSKIVEQALIVDLAGGPVVLTGCAHPGVVEMVREARQVVHADPALVMGGFHLGSASRRQVEAISVELRQLGVQKIAPCHCTGDAARRWFVQDFGKDCILAGVGQVLELEEYP